LTHDFYFACLTGAGQGKHIRRINQYLLMSNILENKEDLKEFFLEFLNHYSPSGSEMEVSAWLVEKMKEFGFDRAWSDDVHNAIGEIGPEDAPNWIVCLGHIDTVNGELPVKFLEDGGVFWGRGAVDAKGPFANFMLSALKAKKMLGAYNSGVALDKQYKLVIVGAVEEELYTSKGAHHVGSNGFFNAENLRAIVIGEPSDYRKMTLGYKGRWNFEIEAETPRTHTAHNNMSAAEILIEIYNKIKSFCDDFNQDKGIFGSHQLHIRSFESRSDNMQEEDNDKGVIRLSIRGSENFSDVEFFEKLVQGYVGEVKDLAVEKAIEPEVIQEGLVVNLKTEAFDIGVKSPKSTPLVRAFLRSMRAHDIKPRFSYKTGTSDMNVLGAYFPEVPILTYGPGDSKLDHTEKEHLYLDHLLKASDVLAQVFSELLPN